MTPTPRQAMEQALEALEKFECWMLRERAIAALRAALAETAEPVGEVAGYYERGFTDHKTLYGKLYGQDLPVGVKLYTAPQPPAPAVELTDEDLVTLWGSRSDGPDNHEIISYARAAIAAHETKKQKGQS